MKIVDFGFSESLVEKTFALYGIQNLIWPNSNCLQNRVISIFDLLGIVNLLALEPNLSCRDYKAKYWVEHQKI